MQVNPDYIPYTLLWDRMPVDISYLFEAEKPAGKHGFMTVEGDRFVFQDGTEMRFWGTNFNSGANFPEHSHSEKVAKRLASIGMNMVRFHQLDSEWSTPNIFRFTKGPLCDTTRELDPRSMERLDYLIYCLKEEGIYVYFDMMTYRKFKSGDGLENTVQLEQAGKPHHHYSRRLIDLHKETNRQLWNHFNPYTKLCYKDEPAIAMTEIVNESDMFSNAFPRSHRQEPYFTELKAAYAEWCREKGVTVDEGGLGEVDFTSEEADMVDFKCGVMKKYYREIIADCREMGVKIPITGTNWSINAAVLEAQMVTDFTDSHAYSWSGDKRKHSDMEMMTVRRSMPSVLAYNKVADKPFFVSEWDEPYPSMYRADSSLLMAAVGSLQGWYGFTIHTYRYGTNEQESVTSKIGRDLAIGGVYYRGIFDTYNDPAKFGLFYHAALITRRADVRQAEKLVSVQQESLAEKGAMIGKDASAYELTPEKHRVSTGLPGRDHGKKADLTLRNSEPTPWSRATEVMSDTGELYRNLADGYGYIDTPMTKAVYGFHKKNNCYPLKDMEISIRNDFATVALSSISNEPIASSGNILLTAVGRADNKGVVYHDSHSRQVDEGAGPVMMEVIKARIRIKTSVDNFVIWSVDNEGFYFGQVPVAYEDGYAVFEIGNEYPSLYYLIQAQ